MLQRVAEGVLVHESECIQSNAVVVEGDDGALVVDPGITRTEMLAIAHDLRALGLPVVAGFSTHPDWDHVLWHERFGVVPRYGTAPCAEAMRMLLANDDWQAQVAEGLPPEWADDIPLELFGLLTSLPPGAEHVPWSGPRIRIIEHRAHAPGHAALLLEDRHVLVAGDMLSDILVPFLDLEADEPVEDYLASLQRFENITDDVDVVIPGHGSVGDAEQLRARIALDRAYVEALRDGERPDDPRTGPSAPLDWLTDVDAWQAQRLAERVSRDPLEPPG